MPAFIAFIDTEEVRKQGKSIDSIVNPYELLNHPELGVVFKAPQSIPESEKLENSEGFLQYQKDSKYIRKMVYCGN